METSVLDNVIWHALTGAHAQLSIGDDSFRRYQPGVSPFGAARADDPASIAASVAAGIASMNAGEIIALTTLEPIGPIEGTDDVTRGVLLQMVLTAPERLPSIDDFEFQTLAPQDVPDMLSLTQATKPGPFGARTIEMGRYIGIRDQGALIAMAGERLKAPGFTEISAVCVDPAYRGRGLAGVLMAQVAASILSRGESAFLHVFVDNLTAIALYERIGFETRQRFQLAILKKT
ncbi:MAG: hypothetical protein JWQ11_2588 [Rhizobacter sp.]|nr:hypothetical protein [Rhizobacter sp.]